MNNDFEKRLLKERDELGKKVEKLNAFIKENPAFNNVSEKQKELLLLQLAIMTQYHVILTERIVDLGIVEMEDELEESTTGKEEPKELTLGMKLVGIDFNPSGDPNVYKAKQLCAELADLFVSVLDNKDMTNMKNVMMSHTLMQILNAQMNVVKGLTYKF